MASCDDYSVAWVCALPVEVAAAKAALDHLHDKLAVDRKLNDGNNYILGSLCGHNVVIAYPKAELDGRTSTTKVAKQLSTTFRFIRLHIMVGIASGVPDTKEDIRLGDVVVGRSIAGRPSILQYEVNGDRPEVHSARSRTLNQPPPFLSAATSKAETAAIFDESQMPQYLSGIVRKDPITFACPGSEKDVLFDADYDHPAIAGEANGCRHCNPDRIRSRLPQKVLGPVVHYGMIASSRYLMQRGATRDEFARQQSVLCFETEAAGLNDASPYLIIRGICDYADSHSSKLWHAYAAAAAAAYTTEVLSFVPTIPKITPLTANTHAEAAPVLDALLLTRPEVDRKSLIALKGRRVDGTCEWLTTHPNYQKWLTDNANSPLLWISGGPGKGKTMLAIFITEVLQPKNHNDNDILLYYFCSNRDKNRNNALAIMRGIIHQWVDLSPHLAQYIKDSFEGTETTKYTVSNFASLWRVFLNLLRHSGSPVVCVLDGLD
jgi:ankyrin repeat domain-containing protein 50